MVGYNRIVLRKLYLRKVKKIQDLRRKGFSIPEISQELKISKSTALRYIKGVEILPEFIPQWIAKRGGSRKRMMLKEQEIYNQTNSLIKDLSAREKLLFLSALYWGEGNKRDLALINSDPKIIRIFITGMRQIFNIAEDRIRVNIRIHNYLTEAECLNYWSDTIGVPIPNFYKTEVIKGKKKGKLKYGMCRIRLSKGSDILKKIVSVNKIVFEKYSL